MVLLILNQLGKINSSWYIVETDHLLIESSDQFYLLLNYFFTCNVGNIQCRYSGLIGFKIYENFLICRIWKKHSLNPV